ncbi:SDR family NAD(P)-dependent oxidoreductase [Nocardia bovistercoris]|uniref:SDR family NAD(P)-dependent oxidoreductase n=1 Tax=Nocardia bovistercoris TaxID=2785916 RepID=A0A931IHQ1_9NOCA|nr:SDR family NAD(P)-dependent oxidoreductase [Nocardia bovistercoris]MBH0780793.1 SDR family NAD(P)-dependent oxidoreductase [Nocardia bovistercoris]
MDKKREAVALITGGHRGIGYEIAAGLGRLGMTTLVGARDLDQGEHAAGRLRRDGFDAHALRLDVTGADDPAEVAAWIGARYGRLDVLVNNAGISGSRQGQQPGSADLATLRTVFATNVFGAVAVTEAMLPLLRRSPRARIVNVTSGLGSMTRMTDPGDYFTGLPAALGYPPSKTALNHITVQYAKHLAPEAILVNAADPGPCATEFTKGIPGVTRAAADGARVVVHLSTLEDDGPTGGYFDEAGRVPW